MTAIGNHERDWPHSGARFAEQTDSGGECGVAHERRFLMPSLKQDEPWCAILLVPSQDVIEPGQQLAASAPPSGCLYASCGLFCDSLSLTRIAAHCCGHVRIMMVTNLVLSIRMNGAHPRRGAGSTTSTARCTLCTTRRSTSSTRAPSSTRQSRRPWQLSTANARRGSSLEDTGRCTSTRAT